MTKLEAAEAEKVESLFGVLLAKEGDTYRYSDQDVLGLIPVLIKSYGGEGEPSPAATQLLTRFAESIGVPPGADQATTTAAIEAYYQAHPVNAGLLAAFKQIFREELAKGGAAAAVEAFSRYTDSETGHAALSAIAKDGPGVSPLSALLAHKSGKDLKGD